MDWDEEKLIFDWKVIWKKYDYILWAWLIEWWIVYVRWEMN